jgi:serine/threonine protein kinase
LADFGSAAYTASKSRVTTHERRGTDSYRAPEVIQSGYFNNRSDIFALGCLVYEVIVGRALFKSDWAINTYSEKNESIFPDHWPTSQSESILYRFGELSAEMLSATPNDRPGAATVHSRLQNIRNGGRSVHSRLADDKIFPPMDETTEAGIMLRNPVLQTFYGLPFASNSNPAAEHDVQSEKQSRRPSSNHGSLHSPSSLGSSFWDALHPEKYFDLMPFDSPSQSDTPQFRDGIPDTSLNHLATSPNPEGANPGLPSHSKKSPGGKTH